MSSISVRVDNGVDGGDRGDRVDRVARINGGV